MAAELNADEVANEADLLRLVPEIVGGEPGVVEAENQRVEASSDKDDSDSEGEDEAEMEPDDGQGDGDHDTEDNDREDDEREGAEGGVQDPAGARTARGVAIVRRGAWALLWDELCGGLAGHGGRAGAGSRCR